MGFMAKRRGVVNLGTDGLHIGFKGWNTVLRGDPG